MVWCVDGMLPWTLPLNREPYTMDVGIKKCPLTISVHLDGEAFLKSTVRAPVATSLVDSTVPFTCDRNNTFTVVLHFVRGHF